MNKSFESKLNRQTDSAYMERKDDTLSMKKQSAVEEIYAGALQGESYEDAVAAFGSMEEFLKFRKETRALPFGSFYEAIEEATNIGCTPLSSEEKADRMERLARAMEERSNRFSPRVADLYIGLASELKNEIYEPKYEEVGRLLAELKDKGGDKQVSDLEVLFSSDQNWEMKLNRTETRLSDNLKGFRAMDQRDGSVMDDDIRAWRQEELKKAPTKPPARRNESRPGVDPMERLKEGERVPAIWTINPPYGGYYKEQAFSRWNEERKVWTEEYEYRDAEFASFLENEDRKKGLINFTMETRAATGGWISLPVPYTHALHKIESAGRPCLVKQDQNGDLVVLVKGEGEEAEIKAVLSPCPDKRFFSRPENIKTPVMPSEFTEETKNKLEETRSARRGNIARAQALSSYVKKRIEYLAPKNKEEGDYYNSFYRTHQKGFAGAVDEIKKADCDVANTYFAALCAKLNIPVRHCVGHSVKGSESGKASINSGTGHGWSEVWNEIGNEWVRIDATPPGDSQLEDDERSGAAAPAPGDYGSEEAIAPSDEKLEELRQKLSEHKEKLSYTKEERRLAQAAGVELKEARQIVREINEAEKKRLPNGELVTDALARLFNAIVEARKTAETVYTGPARKREGGGRINAIVRHKIGMMAGESDPLSREIPEEEEKTEEIFGGFDVFMVGDKSGSMSRTSEGEELWKIQRRVEYLIFSSLNRFEKNIARVGLRKENALSVRSQGISFRGAKDGEIDEDKPLSGDFTERDKVRMWRSLTDQGSGNGDPEALGFIYEQIKNEISENEKKGKTGQRLRLIIACSDGGYVGDDAAKMRLLAEKLHDFGVITVGMGMSESAAGVKTVMDYPPYSHGDIVRDINDLPVVVAKHIVTEAVKLFPEKTRQSAKAVIKSALAKFK